MRWEGHVTQMGEKRIAYKILFKKCFSVILTLPYVFSTLRERHHL